MSPIEYTQKLEYLPDFMRDFHDQKDIFKAIFELYKSNESLQNMNVSWIDAHVFVIDYFLWFMGQHGYKLQKVRKKGVEFFDLQLTINDQLSKRNTALFEILKSNTTTNDTGRINEASL